MTRSWNFKNTKAHEFVGLELDAFSGALLERVAVIIVIPCEFPDLFATIACEPELKRPHRAVAPRTYTSCVVAVLDLHLSVATKNWAMHDRYIRHSMVFGHDTLLAISEEGYQDLVLEYLLRS